MSKELFGGHVAKYPQRSEELVRETSRSIEEAIQEHAGPYELRRQTLTVKEGKVIGDVLMTVERIPAVIKEGYVMVPERQVIKSLSLYGPLGSIDVIELTHAQGITIEMDDCDGAAFKPREKRALVSPLQTVYGVASCLHELGHAEQSKEHRFQELLDLIELQSVEGTESPDFQEKILKLAPYLRERLSAEDVESFKNLLQEYDGAYGTILFYDRNKNRFPQEYEQAQRDFERLNRAIETHAIGQLAKFPVRMCERDADRRALLWMHVIKQKTGIDLANAIDPKGLELSPGISRAYREKVDGQKSNSDEEVPEDRLDGSIDCEYKKLPPLENARIIDLFRFALLNYHGASHKQMRDVYSTKPSN